ncbi:MAG: hypothetical protein LKG25_05345 [Prevotella sp.]|jgi:hypothetical protein|nr:hypothetical protein [Prevotella sp.]MCI1282001.1 hypothetical protein [Prevotella sp.]
MKISKYILLAGCVMAISALSLSSCSSSDTVENSPTVTNGNTMVFKVNKGFATDDLTRAATQPETQRVILPDGLLVDATFTDVGNMAATRATSTTYEDIPDGSQGVAYICAAGSNTIKKVDEFTVSGGKLSISMPTPNTGSYDIYFYLNEDGSLAGFPTVNVGDDMTGVKFSTRAANSKDDYTKVLNVATSATTMASANSTDILFTPLNAELMLEVQAGVTPLSGFAMSLNGIHAASMENLYLYNGNFTGTGTAGDISLNNNCYGNDADRQYPTNKDLRPVKWGKKSATDDYSLYSGALYGDTLWSSDGYQRFVQLNPASPNQAILHITSISGPNGTDANVAKTYNMDMKFKTTTYQNGHRYKLILQLATPINGYEAVGTDGVQTGVVKKDDKTAQCLTGKITTNTPQYSVSYTADATWPCPVGRPQFYRWDAEAYCPTTGTIGAESTQKTQTTADASNSCKYCPTYNQATWLLSAGTYGDNARWYCPNGFKDTRESTKNNIKVQTGGRWFKKLNLISGYDATTPAKISGTVVTQLSQVASAQSKPGVAKLGSTVTNPNEWFYLPAPGYYGASGATNFSGEGRYWLSTVYSSNFNNGWVLNMGASWCAIESRYRYLGSCIWDVNTVLTGGNAGSTTSSGATTSTPTDIGNH